MTTFRSPRRLLALWLCLGGATAALPAQGQDPNKEIQEIARRIDEQLQEIDRLLIESGKKGQARQKPKELLQSAREQSAAVEDGINTLIDKLNQMKNQGGGGSGQPQDQQDQNQQDQQDQQQGGQQGQQQGQRNRRENQNPEFQPRQPGQQPGQQEGQQPGQQPGQQQGKQPGQQPGQGEQQQQPQDGNPQGGQENPTGGENTRGNRQHEPATGPGSPGTGEGSWGDLQPYLNLLQKRGSQPPAVPERFRKYWETYLKQQQGKGRGK